MCLFLPSPTHEPTLDAIGLHLRAWSTAQGRCSATVCFGGDGHACCVRASRAPSLRPQNAPGVHTRAATALLPLLITTSTSNPHHDVADLCPALHLHAGAGGCPRRCPALLQGRRPRGHGLPLHLHCRLFVGRRR